MLLEIRIENLLLIDRAELRLGPGLNSITGETGAGKTVLAHSLDLIMGGKARPNIVRPGASEAYVEGVFELPPSLLSDPDLTEIVERLPEGADEISLGRRVSAGGRTTAFIQGRSASAADLQALGSRLLAFYGQHEHRKLTLASTQMDTLDGFVGPDQIQLREDHREAHAVVTELERRLSDLRERSGARERDIDLLRFELSEIEAAELDPGEEAELEESRSRLRHSEGLRSAAASSQAALAGSGEEAGGATDAMGRVLGELVGVEGVDADLDALAVRARALEVEMGELAADLRSYADGIDSDPASLQQVEERLDLIDRLKRKHGGTLESVIAHGDHCRSEIEALEGGEEMSEQLEAELAEAKVRRDRLATELSAARRKAAPALEEKVAAELDRLAMSGARLEVSVEESPEGPGPWGCDRVEFQVATNPGMPVSPLRDAASGGEMSRVLLALVKQAGGSAGQTFVFDEIDAGIGGNTAKSVGEALRDLGDAGQVLCITHLAQVASLAGTHFRIEKTVEGENAVARVEQVEGEQLVAEIVRMLGGEDEKGAVGRHARELLEAA